RAGPPTAAGRWSLSPVPSPAMSSPVPSPAMSSPVPSPAVPQPSLPACDPTRRAHARAETFLERHGVLTRGALDTERVAGGFAGIYRVLRAMEDSGRCRRGYVVDGLGAAQFAVPGAVDRIRALSRADGSPVGEPTSLVLAATDPAQPYGAALPWPATVGEAKHRPGRKAGALVVLADGAPALYVERGGR